MNNLIDKYLEDYNISNINLPWCVDYDRLNNRYEDDKHIEWLIYHPDRNIPSIDIIYHKNTMIYSTKILNSYKYNEYINKNLLLIRYLNTCKITYNYSEHLYYDYDLIESYNPLDIIMVAFGTPIDIIKKIEEDILLELKLESLNINYS